MWSHRSGLIGALVVSLPSSVMVEQDRPVFSSASDLVVVHATIKDRDGAYVTGLTRGAFAILQDGRPQDAQRDTNSLIVQSPDRRRLVVRARSGYLAGLPTPLRDGDVR